MFIVADLVSLMYSWITSNMKMANRILTYESLHDNNNKLTEPTVSLRSALAFIQSEQHLHRSQEETIDNNLSIECNQTAKASAGKVL